MFHLTDPRGSFCCLIWAWSVTEQPWPIVGSTGLAVYWQSGKLVELVQDLRGMTDGQGTMFPVSVDG
jgi:hypothetical protein